MSTTKEVLAVGCHPDDIEEFAGGTLLLLKEAGYNITLAVMTGGESGSRTASKKEIVRIRDLEARSAVAMLGADYINLGLEDEKVEVKPENTRKLVEVIRHVNPAIILTHPITDYMSDHENTGKLVLEAGPAAKHPNYVATKAPAIDRLPYVYHWDMQDLKTPGGQYASVGTIVDISEVIEQKLKIFGQHVSQMGFSEHRPTSDVLEKARLWGRIRGNQVGVMMYGEGFNQQLMAGYPTKNILAEVLGTDKVYSLR